MPWFAFELYYALQQRISAGFLVTDVHTIVVIHPLAIGDVVLGTPVAAALKRAYPQCKTIYLTHASLLPLLRLCHAIDDYVEWTRKAPILAQVAMIKNLRPDLIVDLTSSTRTRILCLLSGIRYVRYRKQARQERPVVHVCDRYMQALSGASIVAGGTAEGLFPTLSPTAELLSKVQHDLGTTMQSGAQPLIALVPGVGNLRPNRAWPVEQWIQLSRSLSQSKTARLILVGGPDDEALCQQIESAEGTGISQNMAGKLSLPETAALLKLADLVISGDTGPCHIAVSVGTPVVSMMGPTLQQRSGPYGNAALGFDASARCECTAAKKCIVNKSNSSGDCMATITADSVFERVRSALAVHKVS
jgi:heptosyltransferase-1